MNSNEGSSLDLLEVALQYSLLGWSIIPIAGNKKPPVNLKWGPFQTRRADERQLRDWFEKRHDLGLAVVLGAVSGGLTCRDFDNVAAYEGWAAKNSDLAATLPTSRTVRGFHVFFRSTLNRTETFGKEGELRSEGSYVVLAPSRHASGAKYVWIREPNQEIPFVEPDRFRPLSLQRDGDTESQSCGDSENQSHGDAERLRDRVTENQSDRDTENISSGSLALCKFASVEREIERAIAKSLPHRVGERNRKLFDLARSLRGIPLMASASTTDLESIVRRWHQLAYSAIGTKSFAESWADFLHGWGKVKFANSDKVVEEAWKRAQVAPILAEADKYDSESMRQLAALCLELQRLHGVGCKFFLATRTAAKFLGRNHTDVAKWVNLFVQENVLTVFPTPNRRMAPRFLYTGPSWTGQQPPE